MEFQVRYEPADDLILAEAAGRPDVEGFLGLMEATAAVFDRCGCRRIVTDYRGLEPAFDDFTVEMLDQLAARFLALAEVRMPFSSAMVCADGTQFALTRVWEVMATRADLALERKTFLDGREARRWLDGVRPPRRDRA